MFSEADRRQILATQQDVVKQALSRANELARNEGQKRRQVGGLVLLLLLAFSGWRIVRPRAQPARSQAAANFVRQHSATRRPLPRSLHHVLALRNLSGLQMGALGLVEEEEKGAPASSSHTAAARATNRTQGPSELVNRSGVGGVL